jgi:hypothetical protein
MDAGVVSGLLQPVMQWKAYLNRDLFAANKSGAKGQPPQAVAAARNAASHHFSAAC